MSLLKYMHVQNTKIGFIEEEIIVNRYYVMLQTSLYYLVLIIPLQTCKC